MLKQDEPIIVEQDFDCTTEVVWAALTNLDQLQQWLFPQISVFKAELGFSTQFLLQNEDRSFTHLWKITELIPNQLIKMNWSYIEYPGDSYIKYDLKRIGATTKLILTTKVTEDFPQHIPEFQRQSAVDGWNYLIKQSLVDHLKKWKK